MSQNPLTSHSPHVEKCVPPVHTNMVQLPPSRSHQVSRLHLDRRLTCHKHIFTKHKQLGITVTKMRWLLGCKLKLSTNNKVLVYKMILKPIWTYSIQLWCTTSTSNTEILEHFQSNTLQIISDTPWYVPNETIRKDFQIPMVKEEISRYST
jgi:hypothetical protein